MACFKDHIKQANSNLCFLNKINSNNDFFDWQVTTCYYVAIHIINAHLAEFDSHYKTHNDVKLSINPYTLISACKVDEDTYLSFISLQNLSRRSRYLINENVEKTDDRISYLTYEKHLSKAIRHLEKLIQFIKKKYPNTNIEKVKLTCSLIKKEELKEFSI